MIIPVRCFSCGKPIGHLWKKYEQLIEEEKSSDDVLNKLKLKRFCCRCCVLSNVESINIVGQL
jgi:DNA-directed RNA polymerase subunit N (RpoN/RPB10)